jgi:hypothetical protein
MIDINELAIERHKQAVTIEMTHDGTVHTTVDGENKINDERAFVAAVVRIFQRWPNLRSAVWVEYD